MPRAARSPPSGTPRTPPSSTGRRVEALARRVNRANVTGVFLSADKVWGQPVTGVWHHYAVTPPPEALYKGRVLNASQAMAEKKEDYRNVRRALGEFKAEAVAQSLTLLDSEVLYRSEKVCGPVKWLASLHSALAMVGRGKPADNVVWRAVAAAPAGFCHPRSSMAGTLLEDLAAGMDFAEVSRRFAAKMHPLQYQRPQAAPSAGNIAQAEKLVAQLGIAPALNRRFARVEEVEALWRPAPPKPAEPNEGVFGHLKPKGAAPTPSPIVIPPITLTWEKFRREVLPTAETIEFYAGHAPNAYAALVTAVDPDAPPILQWDRPDRRNPVSWYYKGSPSLPGEWNLAAGGHHEVTAVCLKPSQWGPDPDACPHQGKGVMFVIAGARDRHAGGSAIFPETLKAELREVRATIEAYSRSATLAGAEEASACGVMVSPGPGRDWDVTLRVTAAGRVQAYKLDRWD